MKIGLKFGKCNWNVITLEIAKREFMYGWDIYKNPEGYTWNKSTTTILFIIKTIFNKCTKSSFYP